MRNFIHSKGGRSLVAFCAAAVLLAGCGEGGNQNPQSSGSGGSNAAPVRGGAPASPSPAQQQPGSGRVDQGGGTTAGAPMSNSIAAPATSDTNAAMPGSPGGMVPTVTNSAPSPTNSPSQP